MADQDGRIVLGTISREQLKAALAWLEEHKKTCRVWIPDPELGFPYHGAIGGATHWEIVGTSIGDIINYACTCGERTCVNAEDL